MNAPVEMPWSDCKVAFGVGDGPAVMEALELPENTRRLPAGWTLDELDGSGARYVLIFRIEGRLSVMDGRAVEKLLNRLDAETEDALEKEANP